ncbi:MAG TPA: hypothetical protein VNY36_08280, partial [Bacteroidia bacterium]|nr:hypothetical protein [Bacteroidia bacterium]
MEAIKKKKEEELIREHGVLVLTAKDSADYKVYFKTLEADQSYGTISLLGTFSRKINAGSYATVDILKVYDDKGNNLTDSLSNSKDISSYLSDDVYSYDDTLHLKAKAQFSVRPNSLPDGCKVLNLEGVLKVDSTYVIPFKVKDIYIKDEGSKYGEFPKR